MLTINTPDFGKIFATADSFDELRSIPARLLRDGYWALVASANVRGDGWGGLFLWDDQSSAPDDDEATIQPVAGSGSGRWVRIV